MSQTQTFYEGHSFHEGLTWSFVRERIGEGLRELYPVPSELPPKLLAAIRKLDPIESKPRRARRIIGTLDVIEGNYLKRYASPADPRSVDPFDDWPLCT